MAVDLRERGAGVAVRCEDVVHIYPTADADVIALRSVDLVVDPGETVALLGPSGAGKSTLLWLLAGLRRPSAGRIYLSGRDLTALSSRELDRLRAAEVGVVLQDPARNLLPYLSPRDNIAFAQRATAWRGRPARQYASELLEEAGLDQVGVTRAGQLSGGEQQRLAVAVALANRPRVLLVDEPTSQLDGRTGQRVIELLLRAAADYGAAVIAVTHDERVSGALGRTVTIRHGRVGAEGRQGREYATVAGDGTVQLPPDVLDVFPPGSLVRVQRTPHGVELRHVDERDTP